MRAVLSVYLTSLFLVSSVSAETYLCGDPPPIYDVSVKEELAGNARILSQSVGKNELADNIKSLRIEFFLKHPNIDRVLADYFLLYQTCKIVMQDKKLDLMKKLDQLKIMRTEFHNVFSKPTIYRSCRHPDFGQIGWSKEEVITQTSGWRGGGSNPMNWCNNLISRFIQNRSIGAQHKVTVVSKGEENKKDWKGHVEYNYRCTIKVQWNPIFAKRVNPLCGTM